MRILPRKTLILFHIHKNSLFLLHTLTNLKGKSQGKCLGGKSCCIFENTCSLKNFEETPGSSFQKISLNIVKD